MFSFAVNTMHHGKSGWKPSLDNFCPAREIRPSECPYPYPLARPIQSWRQRAQVLVVSRKDQNQSRPRSKPTELFRLPRSALSSFKIDKSHFWTRFVRDHGRARDLPELGKSHFRSGTVVPTLRLCSFPGTYRVSGFPLSSWKLCGGNQAPYTD